MAQVGKKKTPSSFISSFLDQTLISSSCAQKPRCGTNCVSADDLLKVSLCVLVGGERISQRLLSSSPWASSSLSPSSSQALCTVVPATVMRPEELPSHSVLVTVTALLIASLSLHGLRVEVCVHVHAGPCASPDRAGGNGQGSPALPGGPGLGRAPNPSQTAPNCPLVTSHLYYSPTPFSLAGLLLCERPQLVGLSWGSWCSQGVSPWLTQRLTWGEAGCLLQTAGLT